MSEMITFLSLINLMDYRIKYSYLKLRSPEYIAAKYIYLVLLYIE